MIEHADNSFHSDADAFGSIQTYLDADGELLFQCATVCHLWDQDQEDDYQRHGEECV